MVERITDPHQPVAVHGTGRLADGQGVPVPPRQLPLATREFVYGCIIVAVFLGLTVAGIAGWRP